MTWINNTGPPRLPPSPEDIEKVNNLNLFIELVENWSSQYNLKLAVAMIYSYIEIANVDRANFNLFRVLTTYNANQTGKPRYLIATGVIYSDGNLRIRSTDHNSDSITEIDLANPDYSQELDNWIQKWT